MTLFKVAAELVGVYQWLISAWLDREVFKKKLASWSVSVMQVHGRQEIQIGTWYRGIMLPFLVSFCHHSYCTFSFIFLVFGLERQNVCLKLYYSNHLSSNILQAWLHSLLPGNALRVYSLGHFSLMKHNTPMPKKKN
jgi:hypothetical protein